MRGYRVMRYPLFYNKGLSVLNVKELIERLEKVDDGEATPVFFEDDDCTVEIEQIDCRGYEVILGGKAT